MHSHDAGTHGSLCGLDQKGRRKGIGQRAAAISKHTNAPGAHAFRHQHSTRTAKCAEKGNIVRAPIYYILQTIFILKPLIEAKQNCVNMKSTFFATFLVALLAGQSLACKVTGSDCTRPEVGNKACNCKYKNLVGGTCSYLLLCTDISLERL